MKDFFSNFSVMLERVDHGAVRSDPRSQLLPWLIYMSLLPGNYVRETTFPAW